MEHYIVSARKYRPSTFNTVIGQKALTSALKHAVVTDRLAHAYLFCGSRGVGKTSCARIFAKTINCQNRTSQGEACNECDSCRAFNNNTSLNIIELDAASHNGIEDIKSLNEQVLVPPTQGRYRVFIIDEVHMLSQAAFNAFLKTLEEPPEYVIFILATTEKHKIIPTILSRCQIYDFNRITIQDMVEHLTYVANQEGIKTESSALNVIARKADGAMRDALSIFDQVAASTLGNVNYQNTIDNLNILDNTYYSRLVEAFLHNDVPSSLLIYKEVREKGFDSQFFINGLALYLRDLMVSYQPSTISLLEASDDVRQEMAAIAANCTPTFIYKAMDLCNNADLNFRNATNKQFLVELTLVKLCQITAPKTQETTSQPLKPITPTSGPSPQTQSPTTGTQPISSPPHTSEPSTPYNIPQKPNLSSQINISQPNISQPRNRTSSLPSFSINGNSQEKKEKESTEEDSTDHHKNEKYTYEQLKDVWNKYISEHPSERILISTMRSAIPSHVKENEFLLEVDDNIQINTFNEAKADILEFIHSHLNNDYIKIDIILKQGEASPATWTQKEVLQHMVKTHPALKSFISDFSLTL